MKRVLWLLLGGLVGCSSPPPDEGCTGDGCESPKMMDMARPRGMVDPSCTAAQGEVRKTVVDRFVMPTVNQPCAIDVDGDGTKDNALAVVASGLRAASFDLQANADAVVREGALVQLVALQTTDAMASSCAGVALRRGVPTMAPPALDGTDVFEVDNAIPATQLLGTITGGQIETLLPTEQPAAMPLRLQLSLPGGFGVEVPLPLQGAHLSGTARNQGLTRGELHGVVRMQDVDKVMIPSIAQVLTQVVRKMPNSDNARQIIATFETKAKCDAMPDLCCKTKPVTCEITADEVRKNPQIGLILKADVQMFDGERWAPNPNRDAPDSLSVGLCFTTVTAKF